MYCEDLMILNKSRNYTRRGGIYWTCPTCGANLDPGEHCTCEDLEPQKSNLILLLPETDAREAPTTAFYRLRDTFYR